MSGWQRSLLAGILAWTGLLMAPGLAVAATLQEAVEAFDFHEYDNARPWLQSWAEKGQPDAQYRLGIMYEEGLGVEADPGLARKWYQRAAKNGHAGAAKRLDKLRNTTVNRGGGKSVALDWYLENAAQGDVDAQYQLGFIYETGWGTGKDEVQAARWYEEAASNDHTGAQLRLGLMSLAGAGVAQSRIQGRRWLQLAADNKDALARHMLEKVVDASADLELDQRAIAAKVRTLALKSAAEARNYIDRELGRAKARLRRLEAERKKALAGSRRIASTSEKTKHDLDPNFGLDAMGNKTIAWYQRQADQGNVEAQFELARRYQVGDGVEVNPDSAVTWLISAAEQGHGGARYYLAMYYYYGIGMEPNLELARDWLQRAVAVGHDEAGAEAVFLSQETGAVATERRSMALWWLRQYGDEEPVAHFYLGQMFEHGRGVSADRVEADKWYASSQSGRVQNASARKLARIRETSRRLVGGEEQVAATEVRVPSVEADTVAAAGAQVGSASSTKGWLAEFLQLEKMRRNWLWLAVFTLVLVLVPFFIEQGQPDGEDSFR